MYLVAPSGLRSTVLEKIDDRFNCYEKLVVSETRSLRIFQLIFFFGKVNSKQEKSPVAVVLDHLTIPYDVRGYSATEFSLMVSMVKAMSVSVKVPIAKHP